MSDIVSALLGVLGAIIVLMLGGLWQALWSMKNDLKKDIHERHELLHSKLTDYCRDNHDDHKELRKQLDIHKHDKETGKAIFFGV